MHGQLDDIRIYERQLSSNEVAQLYFAEIPVTPPESRRVIDGGGGVASNSMFVAHASSHQPSPVGFTSNGNALLSSGFFHNDPPASRSDVDTDGDGVSDWHELTGFFSDPARPTSPLLLDTDGDGASDTEETLAGTDPSDAASSCVFGLPWQSCRRRNKYQLDRSGGRFYQLLVPIRFRNYKPMQRLLQKV